MDTGSLDLLQFHWWDYENEQYLLYRLIGDCGDEYRLS